MTYLEPSTSLRSRLQSITISAVRVIPGGSRVGRAITLSTGLDPYKGILERIAGVSRGANTEAGADDVAPVTPGVLLRGLDAIPG
jgi:hypothetical protein